MSENNWKQLSERNFFQLIQTIYETNCKLPDYNVNEKQQLINEIFVRLHSFDSNSINLCLKTFYLLIQQSDEIEVLTGSMVLEFLQKLAGLQCDKIDVDPVDVRNVIEAEKCMSYLIYTSPMVQKFYSINGVADAITQRIKETTEKKLNDDIRFFDMRLLCLLTSVNQNIRQRVRETFHELSYLFEIINQIMLSKTPSVDSDVILSNTDVDYLIEILKTLCNLTVNLPNSIQEEEEGHLMRLVSILRELILCSGPTDDKQIELRNHIINLLINMPTTCYEELLSPIIPEDEIGNNGKNIDAIDNILHFLDDRITKIEENKNIKEGLLSVLQLLILVCQSNRIIRKFCRQFILPSINKQGFNDEQTLREKLIRLMINSNSELKTLSTKLLFILCKENANRLIKYTGLTNANEVLHDLDLQDNSNKDQYSSDSDEFDTENDRIFDDYDSIVDPTMIPSITQQDYNKIQSMIINPTGSSISSW